MPNRRYIAGSRFERQVVKLYQDAGWIAIRAAGSHGTADVWAALDRRLHMIACKVKGKLPNQERLKLIAAITRAGAEPILAFRQQRGVITLVHVITWEELEP